MQPKYAIDFVTPLSVVGNLAGDGLEHPASNVLVTPKWRRSWQSTDDADGQTLTFDFGTATPIDAILLYHTNARAVTVQAGSNPFSLTNRLVSAAIPQNPRINGGERTNHSMALLTGFSSALNDATINLNFASVASPSPGYLECGSVVFCRTLKTLSDHIGVPLEWTPREAGDKLDYKSGGGEFNSQGPPYLETMITGPPWLRIATTVQAELLEILHAGKGAPIVFYMNRGDISEVYLCTRFDDVTFAERVSTFDAPFHLVECM